MDIHQNIIALLQPLASMGAGGAMVQQFVEFLKDQLKLPIYLAPYIAFLSAIVLEVFIAFYFHYSWLDGIVLGIAAGWYSTLWHEATK